MPSLQLPHLHPFRFFSTALFVPLDFLEKVRAFSEKQGNALADFATSQESFLWMNEHITHAI